MNTRIYFLPLALLAFYLLPGSALQAQETLLAQRVSAHYEQAPLTAALQDLSRRYAVRFSYSQDIIPVSMRVTVSRQEAPLRQVLDELFAASTVTYRLIGDQIVLSVDPNKQRPASPARMQPPPLYLAKLEVEDSPLHLNANDAPVQPGIVLEAVDPRQYKMQEMMVAEKAPEAPGSFEIAWKGAFVKDTAPETYPVRPVQLSFITPLGTNGLESGKIANRVSINLLAGYAGGVDGVEVGGFLNVDKSHVRGVQLAGFGNVVGGQTEGFQAAGFFNVNKSTTRSMQAAGFINVVADSMSGFQAAGFANIAKENVQGAQTAGFINTAGDLDGFQAAGFINIARKVKGVQLGFLNIADSIESGVPIGFLSFVRKNGYRKFEISGSESLYAHAAFKIGVPRLYNIFAVGYQPQAGYFRWGLGYGLGTQKQLATRTVVNLEGMYYHINEDDVWTTELNELIQLKLTLGYQIGGVTLFGGPTYNLLISRFFDEKANRLGSQIAPWTFYDRDRNPPFNNNFFPTTNLQMWAGFTGGIRF